MKIIKGQVHYLDMCDECCDMVGEGFVVLSRDKGRDHICPRCGIEWRVNKKALKEVSNES